MLPFTVIFAICYFAIPPGIQGIEDIELKDVLRIVMRFVILYFLISTCPNQKNAGIQASESSESIVSLNVGGTVFQTSPSTMLKYPGSKLEKMFNEGQMIKNQTFFLDEDPEYFRIVLNFLRKGELFTFDEENLFDGVFDLAKKFELAELVKVLENDWKEKVVVSKVGEKEEGILRKFLTRDPESYMAKFFNEEKESQNPLSECISKTGRSKIHCTFQSRIAKSKN